MPHRPNIAVAHRHISSNKHTPAPDGAFERTEHDTANQNQKPPLADICNRAGKNVGRSSALGSWQSPVRVESQSCCARLRHQIGCLRIRPPCCGSRHPPDFDPWPKITNEQRITWLFHNNRGEHRDSLHREFWQSSATFLTVLETKKQHYLLLVPQAAPMPLSF